MYHALGMRLFSSLLPLHQKLVESFLQTVDHLVDYSDLDIQIMVCSIVMKSLISSSKIQHLKLFGDRKESVRKLLHTVGEELNGWSTM